MISLSEKITSVPLMTILKLVILSTFCDTEVVIETYGVFDPLKKQSDHRLNLCWLFRYCESTQ